MAEKNQTTVTIHEIEPDAMQQLVEYSYVGSMIITEDNVQVSSLLLGQNLQVLPSFQIKV